MIKVGRPVLSSNVRNARASSSVSFASSTRITNHSLTYADYYAKDGKDWEVQLRQRGRELALMAEVGVPFPEAAQAWAKGEKGSASASAGEVEETGN
jgi:hypothetical protein